MYIGGEVLIHWLQPSYLAASCSKLISYIYIAVEYCGILAAARGHEFCRLNNMSKTREKKNFDVYPKIFWSPKWPSFRSPAGQETFF